jgi:broad specificity phosphatase PhoE
VASSTWSDPAASAGRTLVYLARHGQTPLNESGVLRGLADPSLDEAGQRQARWLGAALGSRKPDVVVASPLRRAVQTARPVADRARLDVVTDERLVDRDYGPWTGVSKEQVIALWGSVDNAPGVEAKSAVRERAVAGLTDIAGRYRGGTVVAVSHDAVNREVLTAFDPGLGDPDALPQDNGCFNTLELREGRWTVLTVNQVPGHDYSVEDAP